MHFESLATGCSRKLAFFSWKLSIPKCLFLLAGTRWAVVRKWPAKTGRLHKPLANDKKAQGAGSQTIEKKKQKPILVDQGCTWYSWMVGVSLHRQAISQNTKPRLKIKGFISWFINKRWTQKGKQTKKELKCLCKNMNMPLCAIPNTSSCRST